MTAHTLSSRIPKVDLVVSGVLFLALNSFAASGVGPRRRAGRRLSSPTQMQLNIR